MAEKKPTYIDYEKISDDVLSMGSKLILRMNVSLARKSVNGERQLFHREYRYESSKYSGDVEKLITIRRSFDYYMTLEKTDNKDQGIMIRVQDIILLRNLVDKTLDWFDMANQVFGLKGNKLIVYKRPDPLVITGLAGNKWIKFEPVVIEYDTGDTLPGCRITLSDANVYCDVNLDKMFGLSYSLHTVNMYMSAQNLVTYFGKPDFGTNLYEFEKYDYLDDNAPPQDKLGDIKNNRQIPNTKQNKSFFDKMNDLL